MRLGLLVILAIFSCEIFVDSVVDAKRSSRKKKKKKRIKNLDLKYIECDVCKAVVGHLFDDAQNLSGEEAILDHLDHACDPKEAAGEWLRKLDIKQFKEKLYIKEHEGMAKCNRECKTVAKACEKHIGEVTLELASSPYYALYSGVPDNRQRLASRVCKKWTSACADRSPLPRDFERIDEKFKALSDAELQMEKQKRKPGAGAMGGMPQIPGVNTMEL